MRRFLPIQPPPGGQSGLTMIEVLITIVIVSFGLLGIAGMLVRSLDSGMVSTSRSIAVMQANEMADRMRANLSGLRNGSYNAMNFTAVSSCSSPCLTGQCGPADQALLDFCLWNAQNQKKLPLGRGSISQRSDLGAGCATAQFFCAFDITISWDESKTGNIASLKQYVLRVEP
ncbi:MAG: type IV pilus modification protein PilV [Rhodocyclaceae bacterium]|nr:type IV pilus modification protein PilV [Rhodocyclaceae bacterium]MCO5097821.1 type IV pilus modification protein PilV [Rhodocyclaceae bacterium]